MLGWQAALRGGGQPNSQSQHGGDLGQVLRETGRCAAKRRGGSTSPLEEHAQFLLALLEEQPDLTLDEVVAVMRRNKVPGSRTAV